VDLVAQTETAATVSWIAVKKNLDFGNAHSLFLGHSSHQNTPKPMKIAVFPAVASLLLVISIPAHAQLVTYDDPADFDTASSGNTSYSFPVPAGGSSQSVTPPYTLGPLSFSSTNSIYALYLNDDGNYGTNQTYLETASFSSINSTISLNGATALALDFGTYYGADTVTVDVNGVFATTLTTTAAHPTSQFFGVTDTTPITSLSFTITGNEFDVLNFQVGSAVPEPSTWMLMFGGVGILGAVRSFRGRTVM
jgi:hypothetical protein